MIFCRINWKPGRKRKIFTLLNLSVWLLLLLLLLLFSFSFSHCCCLWIYLVRLRGGRYAVIDRDRSGVWDIPSGIRFWKMIYLGHRARAWISVFINSFYKQKQASKQTYTSHHITSSFPFYFFFFLLLFLFSWASSLLRIDSRDLFLSSTYYLYPQDCLLA